RSVGAGPRGLAAVALDRRVKPTGVRFGVASSSSHARRDSIAAAFRVVGTRNRNRRSTLPRHARAWPWHPRVPRATRIVKPRETGVFRELEYDELADAWPTAWHDAGGWGRLGAAFLALVPALSGAGAAAPGHPNR